MYLKRHYHTLFFLLYSILFGLLFVYSFTQVDLSLTFSRASFWQTIQRSLQYVGYFDRPLATQLFVGLLFCLYGFYLLILWFVHKNMLSSRNVWHIIIVGTILLTFSYNAFSHDIFNYMFDAKIFTYYQQNPYLHKALDFPQDPYLSFMHWTHRVYPYGPVWLVVSIILSYAGLNYFLPTFFLFKLLMAASFLGTAYFIYKIAKHTTKNPLFPLVAFALNPLVLIESLVSGHNDIVMIFFAVVSVYFLLQKRYLWSYGFFFLSIGIKFATVFLLPVYLYVFFKRKDSINLEQLFLYCLALMIGAVLVASLRSNFQPWYLLYVLPFASLVGKRYYVIIPVVLVSIGALLQYVPYLWFGNWDPPIPSYLTMLIVGSIALSIFVSIGVFLQKKNV